MALQKRPSNRNYTDLVEDGGDGRRVAEAQAAIRPIKDYLLSVIAAMRTARGKAG